MSEIVIKKQRQVNIEILRIIAMILVLVGHYNRPINGDVSYDLMHSDALKAIGIAELKSWTFVCVPCFVMISGYFGIKWKRRGLMNYLFQILYWSILVYLLCYCLGVIDFNITKLGTRVFTSILGNWFFFCYLGVYMLAPLVNAFAEKSSENEIRNMVLAFFGFQTVFGWILKVNGEFAMGMTSISLLGYYLLGAYIKRTSATIFKMGALANLISFIAIGQVCVLLNCATQYLGFEKDVYSYISPLQIMQTIFLFLFCKTLIVSERWNKFILFFSSSAFAGLLLHSWEGNTIYVNGLHWIDENLPLPAIATFIYIILFFAIACCLDKTRIWCWNNILKMVSANK